MLKGYLLPVRRVQAAMAHCKELAAKFLDGSEDTLPELQASRELPAPPLVLPRCLWSPAVIGGLYVHREFWLHKSSAHYLPRHGPTGSNTIAGVQAYTSV